MESAVFYGWQRIIFPCTHAKGFLAGSECSSQGGATFPPDSRQGVNVESVTHPRAALFPGFSEWSLLELKGCSWGGGCKFTRGYSAPDSLHKSTNKSEQTFSGFFFFFCPPSSNELLNFVFLSQDMTGQQKTVKFALHWSTQPIIHTNTRRAHQFPHTPQQRFNPGAGGWGLLLLRQLHSPKHTTVCLLSLETTNTLKCPVCIQPRNKIH